jgi:hypothetical protein
MSSRRKPREGGDDDGGVSMLTLPLKTASHAEWSKIEARRV